MRTLCFDTFGRGGRMRGVRAFDFFDARLDLDADDDGVPSSLENDMAADIHAS